MSALRDAEHDVGPDLPSVGTNQGHMDYLEEVYAKKLYFKNKVSAMEKTQNFPSCPFAFMLGSFCTTNVTDFVVKYIYTWRISPICSIF